MKFNIIGKDENNINKTILRKFHEQNWFEIFATAESISASQYRIIRLILIKQFERDIMHILNEEIEILKDAIKEYKTFEIELEV